LITWEPNGNFKCFTMYHLIPAYARY